MNANDIIALEAKYVVPTYTRPGIVFTHGEGMYLFDTEGKRYLDFTAGIAVTALGHSDPEWVDAVRDQAGTLAHVSNLYHTAPHAQLAQWLVEHSFPGRVFFCNSGSEANETALKFARKVAKLEIGDQRLETANLQSPISNPQISKHKIVAFSGGFHGRTMGALSTTARPKYQEPFAPLVPGVTFATFNDLASAVAAIDDETCAVIVEPVQGEGGIHPANPAFLGGLRALCNEHDALLIFDEVQCGLGRTGTLWAYQAYGIHPDVMTLAKPLAGGLPIGAAIVAERVAQAISVGDHGSTFAAGPLVCRAAQVVVERVTRPGFLAAVRESGAYLRQQLAALDSPLITEIRGRGLLIGVELSVPVKPLLAAARARGLLVINAGENVLRLCPALVVTKAHIDEAVAILADCLQTATAD